MVSGGLKTMITCPKLSIQSAVLSRKTRLFFVILADRDKVKDGVLGISGAA